LYVAINEAPETPKYDLRSIKACISGAAPLPAIVAETFERITGGELVEGFGMTEASPVTHANPIVGRRKVGTIGLPIPDTDCRVVELNDWTRDMPAGEPGEMIVAGPQVMGGYWTRPEETAAAVKRAAEGRVWLLTGDGGGAEEGGRLLSVGRRQAVL